MSVSVHDGLLERPLGYPAVGRERMYCYKMLRTDPAGVTVLPFRWSSRTENAPGTT